MFFMQWSALMARSVLGPDLLPCMLCLIRAASSFTQITIEDEVAAEIGTVEQAVNFISTAA